MAEIKAEDLSFVKDKVAELVDAGELNVKMARIISLRFGMDGEEAIGLKDLAKEFRTSVKNIKKEVDNAERKVFNLLKNRV